MPRVRDGNAGGATEQSSAVKTLSQRLAHQPAPATRRAPHEAPSDARFFRPRASNRLAMLAQATNRDAYRSHEEEQPQGVLVVCAHQGDARASRW